MAYTKQRFSYKEENPRYEFTFPVKKMNIEGDVILIDKPYRCTSFDVVGQLRRQLRQYTQLKKIKVGHAGTLDPLATGLLIICIGSYTKKIDQYQSGDKEYTGTFRVGATTPSYDLEKDIDQEYPYEHITEEKAKEAAASFVGTFEQTPPLFSAIKIEGRRAYELAREGVELEIKSKQVEIKEFEITRFDLPDIDFRVVCSKGTYIRSLARDYGEALQSGAHLTALRRTRIGDFSVENAISILPNV